MTAAQALEFLPYAGFILLLVLLALISGQLYHLHAKVQQMNVINDFKALVEEFAPMVSDFAAAVEKLKGADVAAVIDRVKSDAEAATNAAETELQGVFATFQSGVANLKAGVADVVNFATAVEAMVNPPAPETAPAEQPAA